MQLKKLHKEALNYCQLNQLDQAEKIYEKILKKFPRDIQSLSNLGLIYLQKGEFLKAEKIYDDLYKFERSINFLKNYINLKFEIKKSDSILKIIKENDPSLNIFFEQLLKAYRYLKRFDEALELINNKNEKELSSMSLVLEYYMIFNHNKKYDDAINILKENENKFNNPDLLNINMGISLRNKSEYEQAIQYLQKINIDKSELSNEAKKELIKNYLDISDIQSAEKLIENERSDTLKSELVALSGDYYVEKNLNKKAIKKYEEAIFLYEDNFAAKTSLAEIYLSNENYKEGFELYKWRVRRGIQLNKRFYVDDTDVIDIKNKEINIIGEQGIGDEIFYLRFLDLIEEKHRYKINLYIDERLLDLVKNNLSGFNSYPITHFNNNLKNNHVNINIGSIPRLIDWNSAEIKNVKFSKYNLIPRISREKKRIGISWSSKNVQLEDYKSIKLEKLCEVFDNKKEDLEIISLQYGNWISEFNKIKDKKKISIVFNEKDDLFNDINKLISLVCSCDLVITVCNVTAHIAGLFGIKTILLVPRYHGRLWFWFGEKSRWYPNSIYYIQDVDKNWDNVIRNISNKFWNILS